MPNFTHLKEDGTLYMVDVTQKADTERVAIAKAEVVFPEEIYSRILSQDVPKGDFLSCARVAGILAAKKTSELIPLCHPLPISQVEINFQFLPERFALEIEAMVKTFAKTGVEMEALTAAALSALTIYDMCKALHKGIKIQNLRLVYKSGGKSGEIKLE